MIFKNRKNDIEGLKFNLLEEKRNFEELQHNYSKLEKEFDDLREENSELKENVKKLKINLNNEECKKLSSEKDIQRANDEKELIEMKYDDIQNILEEYRQLPDLKNMIDNLSSLTSPSIDKLIDLVKHTDFKELTKFNERISSIEQKLEVLIDLFRGRRFF